MGIKCMDFEIYLLDLAIPECLKVSASLPFVD